MKKAASHKAKKSQEHVEYTGQTVPEGKESTIGIIGWNSPRFVEAHAPFLDILKKSITAHGGSAVFYGISGGSDLLLGTGTNGHQGRTSSSAKAVRAASDKGLKSNYWLPSRDMVADQIEILVHQERLSGLIMVPWSVSSLVGMMMATIRCGIPTLFLPDYGCWRFLSQASAPSGKKGEDLSLSYSQCSMLVLLEVFGLTKVGIFEQIFQKKEKGSAPAPDPAAAVRTCDNEEIEIAEWGGKRVVEMARQKISPRRFFSMSAFQNAIFVDMALGNSPETILHLSALAHESGVPLPPTFFNDAARKIPQLVPMNRSGEYPIEELVKSGGLSSLLGALHSSLQASPMVVGRNIVEVARENASSRSAFKLNHPYKKHGGLGILFGNLAQEGALFRVACLKEQFLTSSGPARVFDSETACLEAIQSKKIKKGDILTVRYCGPKGSPGMPSLDNLSHALEERGLADSVVILTDGRLISSGRTPSIVHVSPEAAVGSTLSILQDGDIVFWNFHDRALSVRLTDTEIKVRLSRWKEQEKAMRNSYLYRYSKYSSSSLFGATLV